MKMVRTRVRWCWRQTYVATAEADHARTSESQPHATPRSSAPSSTPRWREPGTGERLQQHQPGPSPHRSVDTFEEIRLLGNCAEKPLDPLRRRRLLRVGVSLDLVVDGSHWVDELLAPADGSQTEPAAFYAEGGEELDEITPSPSTSPATRDSRSGVGAQDPPRHGCPWSGSRPLDVDVLKLVLPDGSRHGVRHLCG